MNEITVHAVFDIGKTNKKLFLFDDQGEIVWKTSTSFPTTEDEDGFISDDLSAIENWMKETMAHLMDPETGTAAWKIKSVNFSGYGASLVYLDENGDRLPLFINYLKPFPKNLEDRFFENYGPKIQFCQETASPWLGMLNSGLQIFWLKHDKPDWFAKVKYVLHFPQYLSYIFSGEPITEYTSIGCHTGMWDYQKEDYHRWIDEEGLRRLFPALRPSDTWTKSSFQGQPIQVGAGLHDTSASLIPYLTSEKEPFILLSTGTWTLAINPFSDEKLSGEDLQNDCLNNLRINGQQVRTARLFLGREHEIQVHRLSEHYTIEVKEILNLKWDPDTHLKAKETEEFPFDFEHLILNTKENPTKKENNPKEWAVAYYQLMGLLVPLQIEAIKRAAGSQYIPRLIIEGGFVHNEIFIELLHQGLPDWEVGVSTVKGGSARGVFELVKQ